MPDDIFGIFALDSMTTRTITVTYTISPRDDISPPSETPPQQTLTYPVPSSSGYNKAYTALSTSVLAAQKDLNERLTSWKDAIGDKEKHKEDVGKVGYGKGKAARMMQYDAGRKREEEVMEEDEGEDGVQDEEE